VLLTSSFLSQLQTLLGSEYVRTDETSRTTYGTDALKRGHPADVVVLPGTAEDVAAVVRVCAAGAYDRRAAAARDTRRRRAGARRRDVPERMNRILEIDETNLIAVVEPNVITGDLRDAVERVGCSTRPIPRRSGSP
jgi:FAD/FMN-containing dehydrogenase